MSAYTPSSAAASTTNGSFTAAGAFNGIVGTAAGSRWASTAAVSWLRYDLGSAKVANYYTVATGGTTNQNPTAWTFEGTNDGTFASWTTLDTQSSQSFTFPFPQTYSFSNTTAYQYYRISISAVVSGTVASIGELVVGQAEAATNIRETATGNMDAATSGTITLSTTPATDDIVIVSFVFGGGATTVTPSGLGATWTEIFNNSGVRHSVWRGVGATSSGNISLSAASATQVQGIAFLLDGCDGVFITSATNSTDLTSSASANGQLAVTVVDETSSGTPTLNTSTTTPTYTSWTMSTQFTATSGRKLRQAWRVVDTASAAYSGRWTNLGAAQVGQALVGTGAPVASPVSLTGVTVDVQVAAPAGTVTTVTPGPVSLTGVTADIQVGAPAGTVTGPVALTGVTADIQVGAPAGTAVGGTGFTPVNLTGVTVDIEVEAPAGSLTVGQSLTGVTVDIQVAAPAGTASIGSTYATIEAGAGIETTTLTLPTIVNITETTIGAGAGVDVGTPQLVTMMTETVIAAGATINGRIALTSAPDARTGAEQWNYRVTELDGTPVGELVNIDHEPVEDGVNEPATMRFTIGADDPENALIVPIVRQCQVWQGNTLRLRGPILPGLESDDGTTITYTVHDPSWYWRNGRRTIGRIPQRNLLSNGDFTNGLTGWTLGYDPGSTPAAAPAVEVVDDPFTDGGKAAEITGVESFTMTTSEVESSPVFWPNRPFAGEPLENGFRPGGAAIIEAVAAGMPTTAGLPVTIVGHTADDGTGPGFDLSLRRANAAAVHVAAVRPLASITTSGVGYTDPKPGFPVDSQEQRRVVISYASTVTVDAHSKQWMRKTILVTQPKAAAYPLELTASAWLKIMDDWDIEDANMVSVRIVARRQTTPTVIWDDSSTSIADTDPIGRWLKQRAAVTIPPDDRAYYVDVYLYAPAALARYTRVKLTPTEILYFWGVDQALIVKGIAEHIQDPGMGHGWSITVGTRTPLTGVTRDKQYPHYQRMPADTAFDDFPGLWRGLDIDTLTTPDDITLATFYPRQGKTVDYQLAQGWNVIAAWPASTSDVASKVIAQAQDSGPDRDEEYAGDVDALGGLNLERIVTVEQDTPINELDEYARAELAWSKITTPSYWVVVDPAHAGEVMSQVGKGDTARLILDSPNDVDTPARVMHRSNHPSELRLLLSVEVPS